MQIVLASSVAAVKPIVFVFQIASLPLSVADRHDVLCVHSHLEGSQVEDRSLTRPPFQLLDK